MLIRGKTCFVYDVEVFPNFFSVAIKNTESGNIKTYQLSEIKNELPQIAKVFLTKGIYWVGYNSIHYDAPLINYILLNYRKLISLPY